MEFKKRKRNILAILYRDTGRICSLEFGIIAIASVAFWPHCEAQCSTPSANFTASTNPQLLYSPNYPISYREETHCSWLITSPIATGKIQLRVVRDIFSCCCYSDYLLIKDGPDSSAMPIAILCSELNPISITSSGPVIYGEFRSDSDGQRGLGYKLQFDYFDSNAACPSGWIEREGYCYKLYDEAVPWQQAASRCGYDGGFLTSIADEEENNFLVDSFQGQSSVAWIGMDSSGNWLDGSISSLYNNFGIDSSSISMDCAIMNLDDGGRWRVEDCSEQSLNKFICKKTQDGYGGRYWTEITKSRPMEEERSSHSNNPPIFFITVMSIVLVWVIFSFIMCLGSVLGYEDQVMCAIAIQLACLVFLLCGVCIGIQQCWLWYKGKSEGERTIRTPSNYPSAHQHEVSVVAVQTSRSSSAESRPAYGGVTSSAPPPSYAEALDQRYDFGPTDNGGWSVVHTNFLEAVAPPSYESVVGSAWDLHDHSYSSVRQIPFSEGRMSTLV